MKVGDRVRMKNCHDLEGILTDKKTEIRLGSKRWSEWIVKDEELIFTAKRRDLEVVE